MLSGRFSGKTLISAAPVWVIFLTLMHAMLTPVSALSQAPDHPPTYDTIRLQLKWRHQFQFAGYYAAIEKGYFRNEGLEVELVEGRPGLNPVDALLAGKVDFAIEAPSVLIRRQQGMPLVVVAAIFQHSPTVIMTLRSSGLTTPQDLKGRRIMLTPETDPESLAMLVEEGISPSSVTIIPHNWGVADLIAGRIDGQTAYLTNEAYLLKKEGVATALISPLNYGIDFYGDCIVTTENQVRLHSERLEAFLRAVRLGWRYAMDHPREIAGLIRSRYSQEKDMEQLLFEAREMRALIQPDLVEIGHMNPDRWRHIADTFVKLGMLKADYSLKGFIYTELRDKIASEKRQRLQTLLFLLCGVVFFSGILGLNLVLFNRKLSEQVRKRTASLAESEQHFRAFFEMASVGVAKIGVSDHCYQRMNQKYCDILGYSQEELQGLTFDDITHPEDLGGQVEQMRDLAAGKIFEFTIEKRYIRKNGAIIWAYLTMSPLWTAGQQPETCRGKTGLRRQGI